MTILLALVAIVAALLALAASRPDTHGVKRAIVIDAPPPKVFAFITDFRRWPRWSPFEALDPAMRRVFSGAAIGKGAVYDWDGDAKAGKGRMEVTDASPPTSATITVDFRKPFVAHNVNQFTLELSGASTKVTWAMHGSRPFIVKLMSIFVSADRMLGKHFDAGLANLKEAAEE